MRRLVSSCTVVLVVLAGMLTPTVAHGQSGLDQSAVVFLKTQCLDRQTGATPEPVGTGFIVERGGYVLTAYHVVSCWDPESKQYQRRKAIHGRIGSPFEPPDRPLRLLRYDEQSDVAILKFLGLQREYPTLKLCSLRNPPRDMRFVAAGFPEGRPYQPVPGWLGNTEGGRWAAASPFHHGMSGGPVVHDGFVVGLIKGGQVVAGKDDRQVGIAALSEITPVYRAKTMIESEVGLGLPECSAPRPDTCNGVTVALASGGSTCIRPGSGESFRDCPVCPEMVVVPAGSFTMGSAPDEIEVSYTNTIQEIKDFHLRAEVPRHKVTIARPYAVGKFEVTFAEWDACVTAGGCRYSPVAQDRGRRPVINVTWDNITRDYLPWLSHRTGKTYRLLTEAEWEYAARAHTTTPYSTGPTITKSQANFSNSKGTVDVGSFPPNAFGLYDMHGNVYEWVQDCMNASYFGAPSDGSAWTTGDCNRRVLRSGSWWFAGSIGALRSASRTFGERNYRQYWNGFRVARTL